MTVSLSSVGRAGALALAVVLAACGGHDAPTTPAPRAAPSDLLNLVRVSPQAAVIAAGGTQQLTLTAIALDSTPVTSFDTTVYTSSDSTRVKVSATGLITAATGSKAVTGSSPVRVIASVTRGQVTRADTCYVAVVETQGTNPTFSIFDPTAATKKLPISGTKTISPTVTYLAGMTPTSLSGSSVPIKLSITPTTSVLPTSTNGFYVFSPSGTIHVTATTSVFGVPLTDTITYSLGDQTSITIFISNSGLIYYQSSSGNPAGAYNDSTTLYLQAGGSVTFQNNFIFQPYSFNIEFTAPEGVTPPDSIAGLSFLTFSSPRNQTRTFATPGRYTWKWTGDATRLLLPGKAGGILIVR